MKQVRQAARRALVLQAKCADLNRRPGPTLAQTEQVPRMTRYFPCCVVAASVLLPRMTAAQGLTGALIGTVKDEQGGVLPGARRPRQLPGADWRPGDADHERERAAALPGSASGTVRARHRDAGVCDLSRRGHPHRRRRHHRENGGPEAGGPRGIGRGRGSGLAHRRTEPRVRHSLRPRGPQSDPDATVEHVRLDQGRPRHLAHVAVERHRSPRCPRSAPAPTRTSFSSTARTSPARATASREPSRASTSFRKYRSSRSARPPSSATCRAPSSTSSPGRAASGFCMTRRTTRRRRA